MAHETWDHALHRAQTAAPLIDRPTSAACRLLHHASGADRKFLFRMEPHRGSFALRNSLQVIDSIWALAAGVSGAKDYAADRLPLVWTQVFRRFQTSVHTSVDTAGKSALARVPAPHFRRWPNLQQAVKNARSPLLLGITHLVTTLSIKAATRLSSGTSHEFTKSLPPSRSNR